MNTIHRMKTLGILAILILCVAGKIVGQDIPQVDKVEIKKADHIDELIQRNIERAIEINETQWHLAYRYPYPDRSSIDLIWISGRQKVNVCLFFLASQDDAARMLRTMRDTVQSGRGNPVENLGDEAYSWGDVIRFRKSNVVVMMYASELDLDAHPKPADLMKLYESWSKIAKRFAEHVAEQIGSLSDIHQ